MDCSIATRNEIDLFLQKVKKEWDGRVLDYREKNDETLAILGITPKHRAEIVKAFKYTNYHKGPEPDDDGSDGDVWFFGVRVKKEEVYVKLKLSRIDGKTKMKCLSFHIAEFQISYPYKGKVKE